MASIMPITVPIRQRILTRPSHLFAVSKISLTTDFAHRQPLNLLSVKPGRAPVALWSLPMTKGRIDAVGQFTPKYMAPLHGLYCTDRRSGADCCRASPVAAFGCFAGFCIDALRQKSLN
ncbi:MAG: hypothetical protein PVF82_20045 [Gammaproteobacteria bacterium]